MRREVRRQNLTDRLKAEQRTQDSEQGCPLLRVREQRTDYASHLFSAFAKASADRPSLRTPRRTGAHSILRCQRAFPRHKAEESKLPTEPMLIYCYSLQLTLKQCNRKVFNHGLH